VILRVWGGPSSSSLSDFLSFFFGFTSSDPDDEDDEDEDEESKMLGTDDSSMVFS